MNSKSEYGSVYREVLKHDLEKPFIPLNRRIKQEERRIELEALWQKRMDTLLFWGSWIIGGAFFLIASTIIAHLVIGWLISNG